jgi:hypothetical protein
MLKGRDDIEPMALVTWYEFERRKGGCVRHGVNAEDGQS